MSIAPKSNQSIRSFLDYLGSERYLALNTMTAYQRDLEQFEGLLPNGLEAATRNQLRQVFSELQGHGIGPSSLARKMSTLRHFYKFLRRKKLIAASPLKNIALPKLGQRLPKPVGDSDFEALLAAVDTRTPQGLRDYALLRLLDSCGLRASEVTGLTLADLSLTEEYLTVRRGKGDKDRYVPIDKPGCRALTDYLQKARPVLHPGEASRVFPITRQRVWQIVTEICERAGIKVAHPHQLRHRYGSELVKSRLELREVADLMGHASTDTTQLYVGLDMNYLREVFRATHPRAVKK